MRFQHLFKILIFSILAALFSENTLAQQASVTVNQDDKIPELLTLKKRLEKQNKLTDNYTIQLYYGERSKATATLKRYRGFYGSWPGSIEYETPNYKVWVGNFDSRIEADRAYLEIKRNFPTAFVLPTKKKKK